jgi:YHS domain-containing protein/thiol-disulfide isomerase/thioredoxin
MMLQGFNGAVSTSKKLSTTKAICFALVTFLGFSTVSAQSNESSIRWIDDFDTAVRYASSNQLPLMLHFYGDNCPPCKLLEKRAFLDPVLIDKINGQLVAARINGEKQKELRLRYQVTRWPTDVYLLPTGEEIHRSVSPQDPAVYGQMVDRVALRHRDWKAGEIARSKGEEHHIANRTSTEIAHARTPVPGMNGTGITTHPVSTSGALAAKVQSQLSNQNVPSGTHRTISNPYTSAGPIHVPAAPNPSVPAFSSSELSSQTPETKSTVVATPIGNQKPWNPNLPSNTPGIASGAPATVAGVSKVTTREVRCETVGLDGYCPVSLSFGVKARSPNSWVEGLSRFAVKHRGRIYYCASEEAREAFLASPDQYAPHLSCFDLIHYVKTGEFVDGKCEFGCFQPGKSRVFLFASQENCEEFTRMEAQYSAIADGTANELIANQPSRQTVR